MKVLIILCSLVFGFAFAADDCAPINLITEPNSPFEKIPVYDQDGAGICYAYVASQMMNYQLIKRGKPLTVHPAWAAFRYSQYKNEKKLAGGSSSAAIKAVLEGKNCSYEDVGNEIKLWAEKANATEAEFIGFFDVLGVRLQALPLYKGNIATETMNRVINKTIEDQKPFCSPGVQWAAIFPEIIPLAQLGSRKLFSEILFNGCDKLEQININEPKIHLALDTDEYLNTLNNKLSSSKSPVSVTMCSHLFDEPSYVGIQRLPKTDVTPYKTDDKCGGHELLAVGKKKIDNQCHTLLRNSWGNGFGQWTKNWKCLCKNKETGEFVDECTIATHNNGKFSVEGCYIPDSSLSKNTFGLTTLD